MQMNVYALGSLRKKIENVYIYAIGCQMVEKSLIFGLSK